MKYQTCNHVHDNGYFCQSAAVSGRDYCCYHLRQRGRLLRMAQACARNQPCPLQLPPLENMHAVQSALTQVVEALAADMIDPKRAHLILSALRQAANNLKNSDAWRTSAYANNHSQTYLAKYDDFEAEFGLPKDIDLEAPPEVAFPPPQPLTPPEEPQLAEADSSSLIVRPDFPVSPEHVELVELERTQGNAAMLKRARQMEYNARRRERRQQTRADQAHYVSVALTRNLQFAVDGIVAEKLAAAQQTSPAPDAAGGKKPPASATKTPQLSPEEVKNIA